MMDRLGFSTRAVVGSVCCLVLASLSLRAQEGCPGRVFLDTPETVAIWEFNEALVDIDELEAIPNGTVFQDLSGNGLDATMENNEAGDLVVGLGADEFDDGDGNFEVRRPQSTAGAANVVVLDDNDAFEMPADQSFSIELYVNREDLPSGANWGILAGTWVSRNTLDDGADVNVDGAWYGYGLIRYEECCAEFPTGGWGWSFTGVVDGQPFLGHPSNGQPTERFLQPWFEIPEGRHYLVFSVDRDQQSAVGYVDGMEVTRYDGIDPTWDFVTPDEYEHANFRFFTGLDDPTRGSYRRSPAGVYIDAARVQYIALSAEEVEENWALIQDGEPVGEEACSAPQIQFRRGDSDDSGVVNISDAVNVLNFLFASSGDPACMEAADVNDDGTINITDPVGLLGFLFGGGGTPLASPGSETCGPDPADSPGDLGCETYTSC